MPIEIKCDECGYAIQSNRLVRSDDFLRGSHKTVSDKVYCESCHDGEINEVHSERDKLKEEIEALTNQLMSVIRMDDNKIKKLQTEIQEKIATIEKCEWVIKDFQRDNIEKTKRNQMLENSLSEVLGQLKDAQEKLWKQQDLPLERDNVTEKMVI